MEWIRDQEPIVSYDVNVFPHAASVLFISESSVQLTLLYSTPYNVGVIASRCGQNATTSLELLYDGKSSILNIGHAGHIFMALHNTASECGNPLQQSSDFTAVEVPKFPVSVGTIINFSCPPDLLLTGPNSAVCTFRGQWHPDPRTVRCYHLKGS